jgi:hypothetical protein
VWLDKERCHGHEDTRNGCGYADAKEKLPIGQERQRAKHHRDVHANFSVLKPVMLVLGDFSGPLGRVGVGTNFIVLLFVFGVFGFKPGASFFQNLALRLGRISRQLEFRAANLQLIHVTALPLGLVPGKPIGGLDFLHDRLVRFVLGQSRDQRHSYCHDCDEHPDALMFVIVSLVWNSYA